MKVYQIVWIGKVVGTSSVCARNKREAKAKAKKGKDTDFDYDRKQLPQSWNIHRVEFDRKED